MKLKLTVLLTFLVAQIWAAPGIRIPDYPNLPAPATNSLFIISSGGVTYNLTYEQLANALKTVPFSLSGSARLLDLSSPSNPSIYFHWTGSGPYPARDSYIRYSVSGSGIAPSYLFYDYDGGTNAAIVAGPITGGLFTGNGAGLTNLPAVSPSSSGGVSTSSYPFVTVPAQWQHNIERLPRLGIYPASGTEATLSNNITTLKNSGAFDLGFNLICFDTPFYSAARDGSGNLQVNTSNFPSGTNYISNLHTQGLRAQLWYAAGQTAAGDRAGMSQLASARLDMANVLAWGPDAVWFASEDYQAEIIWADVSTNLNPPILIGANMGAHNFGPPKKFAFGGGVRLFGTNDPVDWPNFLHYAISIETSGIWRYVGPGQTWQWGPELGSNMTDNERTASAVAQVMTASDFTPDIGMGAYQVLTTNRPFIAIARDPAVVCGRLVATNSGCLVWVRPLGTPAGPDFAIGLVNTNNYSTNFTLTFSSLVYPVAHGSTLGSKSYEVWDCLAKTLSGVALTSVSVTMAAHGGALFRLTAPPVTPVVEWIQPKSLGVGDNWTLVNQENYFGPIGSGSYYQRWGWKTGTSAVRYTSVQVPDWVTTATITHTIGADATASWTNDVSSIRGSAASGVVVDSTSAMVVNATNGFFSVSSTVTFTPNTTGQPHWVSVAWNASTNTTANRAIIGATRIEYY